MIGAVAGPVIEERFAGPRAVAAGLVIATGLKLLPTLRRSPLGPPLALAFAALTLLAVGVLRWPLLWVLLGLGGTAVACAAWRLSRGRAK